MRGLTFDPRSSLDNSSELASGLDFTAVMVSENVVACGVGFGGLGFGLLPGFVPGFDFGFVPLPAVDGVDAAWLLLSW
jgi:hypothetical protein